MSTKCIIVHAKERTTHGLISELVVRTCLKALFLVGMLSYSVACGLVASIVSLKIQILTLKAPNKNCSRRHFNFFLLSFEENKA